jgi:hypothetical protein
LAVRRRRVLNKRLLPDIKTSVIQDDKAIEWNELDWTNNIGPTK